MTSPTLIDLSSRSSPVAKPKRWKTKAKAEEKKADDKPEATGRKARLARLYGKKE